MTISLHTQPGAISGYQRPARPGDITPPDHGRLGQQSCRVWLVNTPSIRGTNKVTGGSSAAQIDKPAPGSVAAGMCAYFCP